MREIIKSEMVPTMDSNGKRTVRSRSNFDDDGAHPAPYLQVVSFLCKSYIPAKFHTIQYARK